MISAAQSGADVTSGHLPHALHDLVAPAGEAVDVVDELRRLDADRRETSGELSRDRGERLVQVGHAVRARETAARAADELQLAEVAPRVGERRAQPRQIGRPWESRAG